MLIPAICSLIYRENDLWVFLVSASFTSISGFILERLTKTPEKLEEIERKDGFFIASLSWFAASIFGAIPFMLYGVFENPIDAIFESVSGFTTTGASVMKDIEIFPHGILFWRNFTQWLGGMGIILLAIAILPRLAVGGMQLMALEVPGPATEKLTPKIAETAKKLWAIYLILSALQVVLLFIAGMSLYDSIVHTFTTMSTGGYSTKNISIGAYGNPLIEVIILVFMFIAGANFVLHYWLFKGDFKKLSGDPEFRFYLFLNMGAILFITLDLWMRTYPSLPQALRFASFQVVSIGTTTGYATDNFDLWPSFSKWLLLILMFVGGCAGSTSGAIKNIRIMILFKKGYREIYKLIYPKAVLPIRIGKKVASEDAISSITTFFLLYFFIFLVGTLLVMAEGVPIITAISACAATIGNVGPGLEQVGPALNYADLPGFTKIVLSLLMLLGRLELFTILVLFVPAFWKQ
ncbi:MAG: EscU/YscU/HrcU family type III secretion system export apparatus switch protein [Deltaproteobacteria bacterium]|nr:EscU/YscU/HrcU family type III secretion system export apparatus switch protein [Deltaproteobacteria bacterium]